jgi:hypothetical protein
MRAVGNTSVKLGKVAHRGDAPDSFVIAAKDVVLFDDGDVGQAGEATDQRTHKAGLPGTLGEQERYLGDRVW